MQMLQTVDEIILLWVQNNLRFNGINELMKLISIIGNDGICFIILCAVLIILPKTRRTGLTAGASLAFGALCTNVVLKQVISRPRPEVTMSNLLPLLSAPDAHSFPSGHTCAAFAVSVAICLCVKNKLARIGITVFAVLTGISRIYVGAHYLSDVIAGAVVGSLCAYAVYYVQKRIVSRKKINNKSEN